MAPGLITDAYGPAQWWSGRFDLMHRLEWPSTRLDSTIRALPCETLRRQADLRHHLETWRARPLHVLGYEAIAEGPYGRVRLAALFITNPFAGGEPHVFALDGDRRSLHRNPPFDEGVNGVSASLCLYFRDDPDERRWHADDGLVQLFDIARRHLVCEHVWRKTKQWPMEDAPHGDLARPARPRPELRVPSARDVLEWQ